MLFNSYTFLFLFLPAALCGYFLLGRYRSVRSANVWLVLSSFFFYGYWNVHYLPLLLFSILVNYFFSGRIIRQGRSREGKLFFLGGIAVNVGLLGYYKYMDFFLANINALSGSHLELLHIVLPLGISFFTITQMVYLIGVYFYDEGRKNRSFVHYCLFVSFFPHLLAGPILYYKPMMAQFASADTKKLQWENLYRGGALFIIGLVKKVIIADSFIQYVNAGFSNPGQLTLVNSWLVAVCYALQLYFDFSGYSDMAIGVSRMMNIEIPRNFNSPFRANNLINFWQRWHISLTNAITACIYMPIVQSFKHLKFRHTVLALFVAMFLAGIWHGAGWNYVVFALMHAGGLTLNHVWKHYKLWMPRRLSRVITLLWVCLALVFFRAADVPAAMQVLQAMAGLHGVVWPGHIQGDVVFSMGSPLFAGLSGYVLLLALVLVIWCPNSNEIVTRRLQPSFWWNIVLAAGFAFAVLQFTKVSAFLYFQF